MEALLITLFILVLLLYFIRVSLMKNRGVIVMYILIPAIFPYIIYPWLIEQDKRYIKQLLGDQPLMNDFSLLIMIEALLVMSSIFILSEQYFGKKIKTKLVVLKYIPTLTPVIALCYFELQTFYVISSYSFQTIAIGFLTTSILLLGFLTILIKWLISEWEIRLELTFIICFLQIGIGIAISSFYNSITSTAIFDKEIWKPFVVICLIGLSITIIGFLYTNYNLKKKIKKSNLKL